MESQNSGYKCPHCGEEIDSILFTEWGSRIWNGKEWVNDFPFSNAEFRCSQCNGSLDFNDLEAKGVV